MIGSNWAQTQRLQFLEACLLTNGQVNRSNLMRKFQISMPQASIDLRKYQEQAPQNMVYDRGKRTYRATTCLVPQFTLSPETDLLRQVYGKLAIAARDNFVTEDTPEEVASRLFRVVRECSEEVATFLKTCGVQ